MPVYVDVLWNIWKHTKSVTRRPTFVRHQIYPHSFPLMSSQDTEVHAIWGHFTGIRDRCRHLVVYQLWGYVETKCPQSQRNTLRFILIWRILFLSLQKFNLHFSVLCCISFFMFLMHFVKYFELPLFMKCSSQIHLFCLPCCTYCHCINGNLDDD